MGARRDRFLAFVDFLGTRKLYDDVAKNADRIEDRRYELEHAIQIRLQHHIADGRIEIGVFSDTVLIAGADVADVVACATSLMDYVLRKSLQRGDRDDFRLLRGGVSKGIELRSSYLRSSPAVNVIPFYDGSIAFAYELESVRRGSRLFMPRELAADLGDLSAFRFEWTVLPGAGAPISGVDEFLWPALSTGPDADSLYRLLSECFGVWRQFVGNQQVDPDWYRSTLYHFDETIKCVIRSFTVFTGTPEAVSAADRLSALLPSPADPMADCEIRFIWGIWFQLILVICKLTDVRAFRSDIQFALDELKRRGYLDKFIRETDYADYQVMKQIFSS